MPATITPFPLVIKNLVPQHLKNLYHFLIASLATIRFQAPSAGLTVIGVTGTDGKTTTATVIYHLLKSAGRKTALISTVAAYIGSQEIDTGFHVTSPDPWQLQRLLRRIKDQGYQYLVLEATSHGLDQHRFLGINFSIGVVTNITHEHLDYHGSYHRYFKAKTKLFASSHTAIINQQDQSFLPLRRLLSPRMEVLPYSESTLHGSVKASIIRRFPEPYNQLNATAAVLAVSSLGIKDSQLIPALKSFPGVKGRMEIIPNRLGIKVVVDFAHTPNALREALLALRPQTKGKLIAVFGSAGARDFDKRAMMGKIGSELADEVILTAEDPRHESVHTIITQMVSGITTNHGHTHRQPDRQQAINFALSLAKPGDTVGIFGKGHERSLCFGNQEIPWSDQQAALRAISQKTKKRLPQLNP